MHKLVLLRHGESAWNLENRFTGWVDVDLSEGGIAEARRSAQALKSGGYTFDVAFTSVLKRAIRTLWIVLDGMDLMWVPVHRSWRLNERHYGSLTGLDKAETAAQYGEEQVLVWRRSFDVPPPPLERSDDRYQGLDPRYAALGPGGAPVTESLEDTVARLLPYWQQTIAPAIMAGQRALIAAHGNSLRALVKYLDGLSADEVVDLNLPTGVPLVYELDDDLKPLTHYYLGDPEEIQKAAAAVAAQGKAG